MRSALLLVLVPVLLCTSRAFAGTPVATEEDCDPRCPASRDATIPPLRGPTTITAPKDPPPPGETTATARLITQHWSAQPLHPPGEAPPPTLLHDSLCALGLGAGLFLLFGGGDWLLRLWRRRRTRSGTAIHLWPLALLLLCGAAWAQEPPGPPQDDIEALREANPAEFWRLAAIGCAYTVREIQTPLHVWGPRAAALVVGLLLGVALGAWGLLRWMAGARVGVSRSGGWWRWWKETDEDGWGPLGEWRRWWWQALLDARRLAKGLPLALLLLLGGCTVPEGDWAGLVIFGLLCAATAAAQRP